MSPDSQLPVLKAAGNRPMTVPEPYGLDHQAGAGEEKGVPWDRYFAAMLRYKWLIIGLTIVGGAAGVVGSRFVKPSYEAQATLWIAESAGDARNTGPIRARELLTGRSWSELLRSFAILDKVAVERSLFLSTEQNVDSGVFNGFGIGESIRPGSYDLELHGQNEYRLLTLEGATVDSGAVGDSVGRTVGFRWSPPADVIRRAAPLRFSVLTPRAAAIRLRGQLDINYVDASNLLRISLAGADPDDVALTLNSVADEFVATSAELKKRSLVENAAALREQLEFAYSELQGAEIAYETFRVGTITLPSEGTAVAAGVEITRDPVFSSFFEQRVESDRTRRDREALERLLAGVADGTSTLNALGGIPSVETHGEELLAALADYRSREAALRSLRAVYTDRHPSVIEAQRVVDALRAEVVMPLARALVAQLREREHELETRLAGTSRELRQIPSRTIEEMRLRRNVETRENLYIMLRNRHEEARLAEASSLPDVSILDHAVPPQVPSQNSASMVIAIALLSGLGLGLAVAFLLDRFDRRFRYPDQATGELGLPILGAVPTFQKARSGRVNLETAAQVVEAFRSIRLGVFHAASVRQSTRITVSSPGIGDGKSLVSSNLALSFAEAGYSTLLVDGDIRRGGLHTMFGVSRRPGLVDVLEDRAAIEDALQVTSHTKLTLLPGGRRARHGPELLASAGLARLFEYLQQRYEVIVVDSPPLGAGIDPFALGAVTGNLLLVLRAGETDRHMALAKMEMLQRFPIRVIGAVLNDIRTEGAYRYYSYLYGYTAEEEPLELLSK